MSNRFIIAGGGTGGHIFPALAIAEALRSMQPNAVFHFVGATGKMEMEKVPQAGFTITGLDIVGFERKKIWKNISLPFKLIHSFMQVRALFKQFHPTAVIGVGGYSSYPVLRYAQSLRIPTFLHESNSFAGKSNQWLGKKATRVYTGMPDMQAFFPADRIVFTGNPVRASIGSSTIGRAEALGAFGLEPGNRTLLVIGGSLGARSINQAIQQGYKRLLQAGLQLIWQTGKAGETLPELSDAATRSIRRMPFIQEMDKAYAAADIVVARAGAMSIAELQVVGKPAVLVPYPQSAEDHQTANAKRLVQAQAALLVRDADAEAELIDRVLELNADPTKCERMQQQLIGLGVRDADCRIARSILEELEKQKK